MGTITEPWYHHSWKTDAFIQSAWSRLITETVPLEQPKYLVKGHNGDSSRIDCCSAQTSNFLITSPEPLRHPINKKEKQQK